MTGLEALYGFTRNESYLDEEFLFINRLVKSRRLNFLDQLTSTSLDFASSPWLLVPPVSTVVI